MSELLYELLGLVLGERHGDVRTYEGDDDAFLVAASRRARRLIRENGNRVWVWSEPMGSDWALVTGEVSAPPERRRYQRMRDTADPSAFELMLEESLVTDSLVLRCRPWPIRGLYVTALNGIREAKERA